jgi:2'-5' RNA ligase
MNDRLNNNAESTLRAFIAIDLTPEANQLLAKAVTQWKNSVTEEVAWIAPENYHLTLLFLGDIPAAMLSTLSLALEKVSTQFAPFTIILNELDYFPHEYPKVLAAIAEPHETLTELQKCISRALQIKLKPQIFLPHISVARLKAEEPNKDLTKLDLHITSFVTGIAIYQSHLSASPAKYERLREFKFKLSDT